MSSLGHLGKLPLEICEQIYALLLQETKPILIDYNDLKGNGKPRRTQRSLKHLKDHENPVELLRTSRKIKVEAAPVLYGFNIFIFFDAIALRVILESCPQLSQHLRHIKIEELSFKDRFPLPTAFLPIAAMKLHHLKLSHLDFCFRDPESVEAKSRVDECIESLVSSCLPLLRCLQANFQNTNVKIDILDVMEISLKPCAIEDKYGNHAHTKQVYVLGHRRKPSIPSPERLFPFGNEEWEICWYCGCICADAPAKNDEFNQNLRAEVAKQLGLLVG